MSFQYKLGRETTKFRRRKTNLARKIDLKLILGTIYQKCSVAFSMNIIQKLLLTITVDSKIEKTESVGNDSSSVNS